MVRLRAAIVAMRARQELEAFFRSRTKSAVERGIYTVATDYTIRALCLKPKDPFWLTAGERLGGCMGYADLSAKCKAALASLPHDQRNSNDGCSLQIPSEKQTVERLDVKTRCPVSVFESLLGTNSPVEVRDSGTPMGRGLHAKCRIKKGDVLLRETARVGVPLRSGVCAHCLAAIGGAATECPKCHEQYCSTSCLDAAAADYHAPACGNSEFNRFENEMRSTMQHDASRAALTCLAVAKICLMGTTRSVHPLALPFVAPLQGSATYEPSNTLNSTGAQVITLCDALHQQHFYLEDFLTLFAVVQSNEYFVTEAGLVLFCSLAMANHSCIPNAVVRSPSGSQGHLTKHLVALTDLHPGEQVYVDYTASTAPCATYAQRAALLAQQHISCCCAKCLRRL